MSLLNAQTLFALSRSNSYEVVVDGVYGFVDSRSGVSSDFADTPIVIRSLLKPWQVMATGLEIENSDWAMALASQSGEIDQIHAVQRLLAEHDLRAEDLLCPRCWPMDQETGWRLRLDGMGQQTIYHPCAGKHIAMAVAARRNGWASDYSSFDHPIQRSLMESMRKQGIGKHDWLVDSCGLPTMVASLNAHLSLWQNLCFDQSDIALVIKDLWTKNPRLIGGNKRLDTFLVEMGRGQIIAKEGADGLIAVFSLPQEREPMQGVIVKLAGGYNLSYLGISLWVILTEIQEKLNEPFLRVLGQLDELRDKWVPKDQVLVSLPG